LLQSQPSQQRPSTSLPPSGTNFQPAINNMMGGSSMPTEANNYVTFTNESTNNNNKKKKKGTKKKGTARKLNKLQGHDSTHGLVHQQQQHQP
jgi:hypothetical protein